MTSEEEEVDVAQKYNTAAEQLHVRCQLNIDGAVPVIKAFFDLEVASGTTPAAAYLAILGWLRDSVGKTTNTSVMAAMSRIAAFTKGLEQFKPAADALDALLPPEGTVRTPENLALRTEAHAVLERLMDYAPTTSEPESPTGEAPAEVLPDVPVSPDGVVAAPEPELAPQ